MVIRVCSWHRDLPAPRRWFRLLGISQPWKFWRITLSHGMCAGCAATFRASWRANRSRKVNA